MMASRRLGYAIRSSGQKAAAKYMATAATPGGLSFQQGSVLQGLKVAAGHDDGRAATSAVSVVVRAGSRYQLIPGTAHLLEKFAFKNTTQRTSFRITRETELLGGMLSASLSREHIILSAQFMREDLPYFLELLGEVLTETKYSQHEFHDNVVPLAKLEYDAAKSSLIPLALDGIHAQAYRRGLGNEMLILPEVEVTGQDVLDFARASYTQQNIAVVGHGVDQQAFEQQVAECFADVAKTPAASVKENKYYGGEARIPLAGGSSCYAIAFPGSKLTGNATAELAVLAALLGGEAHVKWSSGLSPLAKLADATCHATATNICYSDTGLFTVFVYGKSDKVASAARAALKALKDVASGSVKISADELQRAVAQAKFAALQNNENKLALIEAVGQTLLNGGDVAATLSPSTLLGKVTADKVKQVRKFYEMSKLY